MHPAGEFIMAKKRPKPGSDDTDRIAAAALLGTEVAEGFCVRLAAAFFETDVKRSVVQEARDAIRKAAQRAGREPSEIEDDVFAALMAEAARQARPPQRIEPSEPSRLFLSGDELDRKVLADYPAPIARPCRTLFGEAPAAGEFGCLLDGGHPNARFAAALEFVTAQPSGLAWAGSVGNHLYIIRLEGAESQPPSMQSSSPHMLALAEHSDRSANPECESPAPDVG